MSQKETYCDEYIPREYQLTPERAEVYIPSQFVSISRTKYQSTARELSAYFVDLATNAAAPLIVSELGFSSNDQESKNIITPEMVADALGKVPEMDNIPLAWRFILVHTLHGNRDAPIDTLAAYDLYYGKNQEALKEEYEAKLLVARVSGKRLNVYTADQDRDLIGGHLSKALLKYYHLRPELQPTEQEIFMAESVGLLDT